MMLKLENVSKQFNAFSMEEISVELPGGYIMGLVGENGAGKTTLIHLISGLLHKDEGRLWLNGVEYDEEEEAVKQEIGAALHGDVFDGRETLIGNARRYGRFYSAYDEKALGDYAFRFGLDIRKKYGQLSRGEKLKFMTAFALSHRPKLLLLDEPAANFDKEFREIFFTVLREYVADGENMVILSTHLTSDIEKIADYLLYLKGGKQMLFGDIERIRENYRMVAGEEYKIRLLTDRVIHMEHGQFGSKALVHNSKKPFDSRLKVWEPSVEELMYYMAKGWSRQGGRENEGK
ncbi:MAG: ABC transporter ATP-binding protein [Bacteroidales bacterium]|nr:ABC transporter ATP-binding protein [Clostridium sp.]MCM1204937.1 ABC transporter ATP-binding protein [Bacteroidales bacterium]